MNFIEEIKKRASNQIKTIVLPEATDIRILEATDIIGKEGFAKIILLGNESEIISIANKNKLKRWDNKFVDVVGTRYINNKNTNDIIEIVEKEMKDY